MGNVTISHWKMIQAMLKRGQKPSIGLIETALEQKDPMPVEMNEFILRVLRGEKGLLANINKKSVYRNIDIYLKIIRQEYGDETATDFIARVCKGEPGDQTISKRTLDSQVAIVKSILGFDAPKKTKP
jgi:hypothetical protein